MNSTTDTYQTDILIFNVQSWAVLTGNWLGRGGGYNAGSGQNIEKQNIESQNIECKISKWQISMQNIEISKSRNIEVAEY